MDLDPGLHMLVSGWHPHCPVRPQQRSISDRPRLRWLVTLLTTVCWLALPATAYPQLHPSWQLLAIVYETTDFSYVDGTGISHRVIGTLTATDMARAEALLRQFADVDVPALTKGNMRPTMTVRRRPTLSTLSPISRSWWPSPPDIGADRDPAFDSIIVVWQTRGIDQLSGRVENLSEFGGLGFATTDGGVTQIYASTHVSGANLFGFSRNLLKHEWGHGILQYYAGTSPMPVVDNHIGPARPYVQCMTGTSYLLVDETDALPLPNSIYNNDDGFTHDYYSGTTATPDQPARCLGITPPQWQAGGPVTKTGGSPAPPPWMAPMTLKPPAGLRVVSVVSNILLGNTVTVSWDVASDSLRPTGYMLEGGIRRVAPRSLARAIAPAERWRS